MSRFPDVSLADVDDAVLEELLDLAKRDASPDEVAPPLGGPGWNLERTAWFLGHHRAATGLAGGQGEKTWAVLCEGKVAGSVRLKLAPQPEGVPTAETGIWLGRSFRSRGIGTAALRLVLAEARTAGIARLTARTLAGNGAARRLLASLGGHLTPDADGTVHAVVDLPTD